MILVIAGLHFSPQLLAQNGAPFHSLLSSPLLINLNSPQSRVRNSLSLSPPFVFAGANNDQPVVMVESSPTTVRTVRPATEQENSSLTAVARAINIVTTYR